MKKIFLLALLLSLGTASFSQNVIRLFEKSNAFFTLLEEDKFDTAQVYFDIKEQAKVSPTDLKRLWTSVRTNFGKTISLEAIRSKIQGESYAITVEGKFEKNNQNFLLLFNKDEKIIGFYMPPNVATYAKPAYADTNLYTEKSVYLPIAGHQIAAMITVPKNKTNFPLVVLVHGSGPSDLDEAVGANKPFRDLAFGLAAKGIATIRYVKRTLIYANEFSKTFTVKEEVIDDALSAIAMAKTVKGVDQKSIFVLGHSLGGMLAPKIATLAPELKGIILAAAPARKLTDLIVDQNKYMFETLKDTTQAGKAALNAALVEVEKSRISNLGTVKPDSLIIGLPASYWSDLNLYDQVATAKKLTKRILVVQGGNDFQVGEVDYNLWNAALSKKANATLKFYPTLNHLLSAQTEKGTSQQYFVPANVAAPLIDDIAAWIKLK